MFYPCFLSFYVLNSIPNHCPCFLRFFCFVLVFSFFCFNILLSHCSRLTGIYFSLPFLCYMYLPSSTTVYTIVRYHLPSLHPNLTDLVNPQYHIIFCVRYSNFRTCFMTLSVQQWNLITSIHCSICLKACFQSFGRGLSEYFIPLEMNLIRIYDVHLAFQRTKRSWVRSRF